jgi:DNA polymerase III alpha subunit
MAFVKLADAVGEVEIIVFPKVFDKTKEIWKRDSVVLATGRVDGGKDGEPKLIVETVKAVSRKEAQDYTPTGNVYIPGANANTDNGYGPVRPKAVISAAPPKIFILLRQIIKLPQTIEINEESIRELAKIFGSTNVIVK